MECPTTVLPDALLQVTTQIVPPLRLVSTGVGVLPARVAGPVVVAEAMPSVMAPAARLTGVLNVYAMLSTMDRCGPIMPLVELAEMAYGTVSLLSGASPEARTVYWIWLPLAAVMIQLPS